MNLAFFDIDGTLVAGRSEVMFWRYLASRGRQGPRHYLAWLGFLLRRLPTDGLHAARINKAYLSGLTLDDIANLAPAFVAEKLVPALCRPTVQRLKEHLDRGDTVVLLSGTLEVVARALADHLGAQQVRATQCAQRDGRFLARAPVMHPFGEAKRTLAQELARDLGSDLKQAAAYGDSHHDIPLLAAVGHPVAVRPDAELAEVARERGWEVLNGEPAGERKITRARRGRAAVRDFRL